MSEQMKSVGDHKSTEGSISAMKEYPMEHGGPQGGIAQATEPKRKSAGRKKKRAREIARILREELPQAFARRGDLEAVSEDYGVAKIEVLAEAVLALLRRPMGTSPTPMRAALRRVA